MKKSIVIVLAVALLLGLTACGRTLQPAATEPTVPPTMAPYEPAAKSICLLVPEAEGWDAAAAEAAKATADEINGAGEITITVKTYADAETQAKLLEEIAAASTGDGALGVVLMCEGEETEAALQKLLEANVSYALAGNIPQEAAAASVANVHYDHRQIGAAAAQYLVTWGLTQKNDVVILEGVSEEDALKTEGFKLYLEGKMAVNGYTIETPWDSFATLAYSDMESATREGAKKFFETYMEDGNRAYTGYFATWDDAYLLGILDALQDEKISSTSRECLYYMKPVFTGFGASTELVELRMAHLMLSLEDEPTELDKVLDNIRDLNSIVCDTGMLAQALQAMADHMTGKVVEQDQLLPVQWVWTEVAAGE